MIYLYDEAGNLASLIKSLKAKILSKDTTKTQQATMQQCVSMLKKVESLFEKVIQENHQKEV